MQEKLELTFQEPKPVDWSFDDHTRMVGREGIAKARAILESRGTMASAA